MNLDYALDYACRSCLEAEGYAIFGLTGSEDGTLYRDAIVRLYIPSGPLPYHCLTRVCIGALPVPQSLCQLLLSPPYQDDTVLRRDAGRQTHLPEAAVSEPLPPSLMPPLPPHFTSG